MLEVSCDEYVLPCFVIELFKLVPPPEVEVLIKKRIF
jgi:hypothetical protein